MATPNQTYSTKSGGPGKQVNWSDKMLARIKGIWPKFSTELSSGEYGSALEQMDVEYSKPIVEMAIDRLKREVRCDDPPAVGAIWDECQAVRNAHTGKNPLYDDNCPDCLNGWRYLSFDDLAPHRKNKLIKTYRSLEEAKSHTQVVRCHCWKGAK